MRRIHRNHGHAHSERGMSLLELIIACTILMVLSSAALPIARYTIVHKKEELLHYNLRQMRDAIDRYKDLADSNKIRVEADWGLRAVSDDSDSQSWAGKNVFDVYSKSQATASDGTRYADW